MNCEWWRHQIETFSALLAICEGNSSVTVFFDLRMNKRLSKQSWDWWFETPSLPLWRHCNGFINIDEAPGLWFMMKMSSYRYKNSHWETIAIIRSSYPHTGETTSLYWISRLDANAVYFRHVHLLGNCPKRHEIWNYRKNIIKAQNSLSAHIRKYATVIISWITSVAPFTNMV